MLEFFIFIKMEFYTYIIFSNSLNKFYIGSTANIEERILRHNQKSKGFTGNKSDWILYQLYILSSPKTYSFPPILPQKNIQ